MTWQEAKAHTQERTRDIVALIPGDQIAHVDQHETGTLFSCDETRHQWTGITFVTLVPGADFEATVKDLESQLREVLGNESVFSVTSRRDILDDYAVTAASRKTAEAYLIGMGDPGTIAIDSWSACFTLPEGVYPGGKF
jgi:hypothetical protein